MVVGKFQSFSILYSFLVVGGDVCSKSNGSRFHILAVGMLKL